MRRGVRFAVLGSAVMGLTLGLASPSFAQIGRVGGQVTDDDGQPIVGATVVAENPSANPNTLKAETDGEGRYSMTGLQNGTWVFTASAPGYAPTQGSARVQTLKQNPPINFKLAAGVQGPLGALAGVDTEQIQAELQSADMLFNAGQFDAAIAGYQSVLEKVPALSVVNLSVGNAYRAKKDYDKAIEAYEMVLKDDPTNEKAKIGIGMTNLEKGDFAAAEVTLAAAAETAEASAEGFYNLGEVKFAKGEAETAAEWYQKAVDADPNWGKPLFKLGLVALNKEDYATARTYLEKLIEVDPSSAEAAQAQAVLSQIQQQ